MNVDFDFAKLASLLGLWPLVGMGAALLLVWGIAPGWIVRLASLAFRKGDARRNEMIAELYAVPHLRQPVWALQQCERALSEGLAPRLWRLGYRRLAGRFTRRTEVAKSYVETMIYPIFPENEFLQRYRHSDDALPILALMLDFEGPSGEPLMSVRMGHDDDVMVMSVYPGVAVRYGTDGSVQVLNGNKQFVFSHKVISAACVFEHKWRRQSVTPQIARKIRRSTVPLAVDASYQDHRDYSVVYPEV